MSDTDNAAPVDGARARGNDDGDSGQAPVGDTAPDHARHRPRSPAHIGPRANSPAAQYAPRASSSSSTLPPAHPGPAPRGTSASPPASASAPPETEHKPHMSPASIALPPMSMSAPGPRIDLSGLALHSPSNIVGTPAPREDAPYEYPFPREPLLVSPALSTATSSSFGTASPIGVPLASPRPICAGVGIGLSANGVMSPTSLFSGVVSRSPPPTCGSPSAHPRLQLTNPPIPPTLLQKARARSNSCRNDNISHSAHAAAQRSVSTGSGSSEPGT
ncbi:hypothetical protein FB107DRAFT_279514 [Schizophyllum commune]